ncbi:MAG: SGNH/GDSL hydrolase family protein [Bacteroidaceae bacterium]|nr:SGNH/GDSL hydrolase family protein [Bacteroidaceae bacterium]
MKKTFFLAVFITCCHVMWAQAVPERLTVTPFPENYFHLSTRGSMTNSLLKFQAGGEARVAFLGGSITEMKGWHNLLMDYLQKRFPQTKFDFVEAGIASMGSTPHAFRLVQDVLSKGKLDLLFFEATVNDETNGFTPLEQVRAVEGVVHHTWTNDAETDIVILHFTREYFVDMVAQGQLPDVVLNHERVANHYLVPTVNLVQEISERILDGEFTWADFGGDHPTPMGQQYYAASIIRLMETMWNQKKKAGEVNAHQMPAAPLDAFSYTGGDFIDIREARLGKGWMLQESWHPEDKVATRQNFVDVPMLETTTPGSKLTLDFTGRAIGYCGVAGPSAGILEYSVDGAPFRQIDTFTSWSAGLYIPWVYMFETELQPGEHRLVLKMSSAKNEKSKGHACQIRQFVVNR